MPALRLDRLEFVPAAGSASAPQPGPGAAFTGQFDDGPQAAGQTRRLRARVPLQALPTEAVAIYVASARRPRIHVNGVALGNASLSDASAFSWNHPIFYSVPTTLLRVGDNTIDLDVQLNRFGRAPAVGLQLGPHALLQQEYDRVYFWRVTGPQVTSLAMLLVGLPALGYWWRRRAESVYGWFGAACALTALRNGHLFIVAPSLSRWYEAWAAVPLHWLLLTLMMFSIRLCRQRYPRVERALLGVTIGWSVLLLAEPTPALFSLGYLWLSLVWAATFVFVAWQYRRSPATDRLLLLIALAVAQGFGALDLLLLQGLRQDDARIFFTPYSTVVFALVMGVILVDALARSSMQQEQLNRELDARLAEREREIAAEHARVLQLQREQAAAAERERIMRELHDGLGSNLISSIHAVEAGDLGGAALARLLHECLDDLRLAVDSLRPTGADLLAVLGNLRYRLQPRLAHASVRLEWHISASAESPPLTPDQVLHTLRVVQEAIANALEHAAPGSIGVHFETGPGTAWRLSVSDDGPGFGPQAASSPGNGLHNMRVRAARIPAQLRIGREQGRTVVELSTPA